MLFLRYFRGYTQSEIAEEMELSQAQISRILSKALADIEQASQAT